MNIQALRVFGVWVLLAAMVFALVKLDTVAEWVWWWLPFVGLGAALMFAGKLVGKKQKPTVRE